MEKIRAILMRPGRQAKVVFIDPNTISKAVGTSNIYTYRKSDGIVIFFKKCPYNRITRANRIIKDKNSRMDKEIMYGNALAVGSDNGISELRSLTDDEVMECMIDYRVPELKDYVGYGLKCGDEIEITNMTINDKFWMEKKPDKILVVKDYRYFISCEGVWKRGKTETRMRFSINKPIVGIKVVNKRTGEVLI